MRTKIHLLCGALLVMVFIAPAASAQTFDSSRNQSITTIYEYNKFRQGTDFHWHLASLEYKRPIGNTTVIGRVNYADRRGNTGFQGEIDAYPRLAKKIYAYTSIGVAHKSLVFPKIRLGTSVYFNLPGGVELESGARYIHFTQDFWMLTAGIGKYVGNWLIQGRSFISLNDKIGTDQSYAVTARYYLPSGRDYVWGQVGSGVSPDENQGAQLQIASLHRYTAAGGIRTTIAGRHLLIASVAYARNEYRKDVFGKQLTGTVGYGIKF